MNLILPRMRSWHRARSNKALFALLTFSLLMLPLAGLAQVKDLKGSTSPVKMSTEYSADYSGVIRHVTLQGDKMEYPQNDQSILRTPKTSEEMRQITANITFDDSIYEFIEACIKDEKGRYYSFNVAGGGSKKSPAKSPAVKTLTIEMPSGVYSILFSFTNKSNRQSIYVVKENVDFDTTSTLDINVAEATNKVHFTMRLPNGEVITPQVAKIINEYGDEEIVREGNISKYRNYSYHICIGDNFNKCHLSHHFDMIPYDYEESDFTYGFSCDISARTVYINDVSSNVSIYYIDTFFLDGKIALVEGVWHGGDDTEVDNINVPYVSYDFESEPTPYSKTITKPEGSQYDPYRDLSFRYRFIGLGYGSGWQGNMDEIRHISVSKMSNIQENDTYLYLEDNEYGDYNIDPEFPQEGWWTYYPVTSSYLFLSDDHEFINGYCDLEYSRNVDYQFPDYYSNPLAFNANDTDLKTGETTPFWRIRENDWPALTFSSIGILGEQRSIDFFETEVVNVSIDGVNKTTEAGYNNYGRLNLYGEVAQPGQKWEIELQNNNIEVEGLKGRSTINLDFTVKGIPNIPVLQQIQYRNTSGIVTNKFNSPEEATIILALGNFSHYPDMETYFDRFECDPEAPELTVEYAPYNTDDWRAIDCVEDEEKFFLPGMGHYFYGSLAGVNAASPTHWYDLRVSLRAANGDTQTQVISPAFRIENITGVNYVHSDKGFKVEGNSILATGDIRVIDLNGRTVTPTNLPSGLYIVLTDTTPTKVIIR